MHIFKIALVSFLFLNISFLPAQNTDSNEKVFLLGNFADIKDVSEIVNVVESKINKKTNYLLILNGDITDCNLNNAKNFIATKSRISELTELTTKFPQGKILIVPGDRDWLKSEVGGLKNVEILQEMLKPFKKNQITFQPKDGCPGPKIKKFGKSLSVVSINTQWFNHPYDKPRDTEAECKYTSEVDYLEELGDAISENDGRNILVVGHYPILSNGLYGGRTPISWHLAPVVGTFYSSYRQNIGNTEDIVNKRFEHVRRKMEKMFSEDNSLIYASGHDYDMQILRKENNFYINSGAIGRTGKVFQDSTTLFKTNKRGLVELNYAESGKVTAQIHYLEKDIQSTEIVLMNGKCEEKANDYSQNINSKYIPCAPKYNKVEPRAYDEKVTKIAGAEYELNKQKWLLGVRYRDSWTTEITVPLLDLKNKFGGLTPYKVGGGRQTNSLKFKAGNGKTYTFRSVNKDLKPVIPVDLRGTGAAELVQDQTAGQQPFGAMAADIMLNEFDIPHAHPVLYAMPDDESLGIWREQFSGMLGMLEEDPKDWEENNVEGFFGADDVEKSYQMFHELYDDHDSKVDVEMLAKARIFDIFVGDWGKHQDNWKWAEYKQDGGSLYKPIPRDRDHIFSKWDGAIPYLYTREWAKGTLARFNAKFENVEEFVWPARELDRFLLTSLNAEEWEKAAKEVQAKMTNEVIHKAIMNMPTEIYEKDGKEIEEALIARRALLVDRINTFYLFLAEEVDVVGSNKKDYFEVERLESGDVKVEMYDIEDGEKDASRKYYSRTFKRNETKEVRLFGLGNEDEFQIKGESDKSILIRIIPGPGEDVVVDESSVKGLAKNTLVYENSKDAKLVLNNEAKSKSPWNDNLYYYNKSEFKYDRYTPPPSLSYNRFDGFGIGLGLNFVKQKWGKQEYSRKHRISGNVTTKGFYSFRLQNRFRHVIHKWDLLLNGAFNNPGDVRFFYGYGPNSTYTDSLYNADFYLIRRNSFNIETGFGREFFRGSEFQILIGYEHNDKPESDSTNLLEFIAVAGEYPIDVLEATVVLDLDFRDNKIFPKNGARLYSSLVAGSLLSPPDNKLVDNYQIYQGSMEYFTSTRSKKMPITFGLKLGYETASTETPFYKMPVVGLNNHLKGYRRNRFSSNELTYLNAEVRFPVLNLKKTFVPLEFGLSGFYDVANVNTANELGGGAENFDSYGGGIYMTPWTRSFTLSLSAGFSEEEKGIVVFGLGTFINNGENRKR